MKPLIIVTGPPGGGKTTYARSIQGSIYDQDSRNKANWRDHPSGNGPAILVTTAPAAPAKQFWLSEARRNGFSPRLVVVDPGRSRAADRLLNRETGATDAQRRRLSRKVGRWYRDYSPHDEEVRVDG